MCLVYFLCVNYHENLLNNSVGDDKQFSDLLSL